MTRTWLPVVVGIGVGLFSGWVIFPMLLYSSHQQPFPFSHAVHTGESVGMSCEDCHGISERGTFGGIPSLEQCATCHGDVLGSSEAERTFVEEYVRKNIEVPWLVYSRQPDNVYFSHVVHTRKAALACEECHAGHGKTDSLRAVQMNRISGYTRDIEGWYGNGMPQGSKMDDCIDCHARRNERTACLDCHK
jgi:hypothetical protein